MARTRPQNVYYRTTTACTKTSAPLRNPAFSFPHHALLTNTANSLTMPLCADVFAASTTGINKQERKEQTWNRLLTFINVDYFLSNTAVNLMVKGEKSIFLDHRRKSTRKLDVSRKKREVAQPLFPGSVVPRRFLRTSRPSTNAPDSSFPRREAEFYCQVAKVEAVDDELKPFPESLRDVSNFMSRGERFLGLTLKYETYLPLSLRVGSAMTSSLLCSV